MDKFNNIDLFNNNYLMINKGIEAGKYVLETPLILDESNDFNFIKAYRSYIFKIMSMFYSNSGLFYERDAFDKYDNDVTFEIFIHTNMPDGFFDINFAFLLSCIQIRVDKFMIDNNIKNHYHSVDNEGNTLHFALINFKDTQYQHYDNNIKIINELYGSITYSGDDDEKVYI